MTVVLLPFKNGNVGVVVDNGPTTCQVTLLSVMYGKDVYTTTYQLDAGAWVYDTSTGIKLHCRADGSVEVHY